MVLNNKQKIQKINDIKENNSKYIVLNIENINSKEDKDNFINSIEILNLINIINWANDLYKTLSSNKKIDVTIIYKVLEANLFGKTFTNKELNHYYHAMIKLEKFYTTIEKFKEIDTYIPYEIEFTLLGLHQKEYKKINEFEKDKLHDTYNNLYSDMIQEKIPVTTFIIKIKEIIDKGKF